MWFKIDNDILDRYGEQLGPYGLAVYMCLARFANQELVCWPSYETIAKRTGMSRRKVIYEVNKLVDMGLIEVSQQYNPETKEHRSNLFKLVRGNAQDAPPPHASYAPPHAQPAPKKNKRRSYQPEYDDKEVKRRKEYLPEEFRGIILGYTE